jgi:hypothetical protein
MRVRLPRARSALTTVLELAGWICVAGAAWWTAPALGLLVVGLVLVYLAASSAGGG